MRLDGTRFEIGNESPDDIEAIYTINRDAFGRHTEADLANRLRADNALILSQVATLDDEIVGHAAYSLVRITNENGVQRCPALGPIAVAPAYQRRGIGSALVRAGLKALRSAGYPLLFLVGHVSYYPRFGFRPALPLGFTCDYVEPDGPHQHFMVAQLNPPPADLRGHVRFHPAFDEN